MRPNLKAINLRSKIDSTAREYLSCERFQEIPTPLVLNSVLSDQNTFDVHSHGFNVGHLVESPQIYKLLLIGSGIERYYQIAPCFRAETPHDRKIDGLHYQIDIESIDHTQSTLMSFVEALVQRIFTATNSAKFLPERPFPSMTFHNAIKHFGSDKPDLRNPLTLLTFNCGFLERSQGTHSTYYKRDGDHFTHAIIIPEKISCDESSVDEILSAVCLKEGIQMFFERSTDVQRIRPYLEPIAIHNNQCNFEFEIGDSIYSMFLLCDQSQYGYAAGRIRNQVAKILNLVDENHLSLCWVTDFPMFHFDDGNVEIAHNYFSLPIQAENDGEININTISRQFDLICNGIEILSGAERNTDLNIIKKIMDLCGNDPSAFKNTYPELYSYYHAGLPKSTGCAVGIDRLMMIILEADHIDQARLFTSSLLQDASR